MNEIHEMNDLNEWDFTQLLCTYTKLNQNNLLRIARWIKWLEPDAGLRLGQRHRRWANIEPASDHGWKQK